MSQSMVRDTLASPEYCPRTGKQHQWLTFGRIHVTGFVIKRGSDP